MTDITMVGFVPSAPLLVSDVAGGSAPVDDELRDAAIDVVGKVCAATSGDVIVAAGWSAPGEWAGDHTWGFEGFGVRRRPVDDRPRLPWPLGIGDWLLDRAGWTGGRHYLAVERATTTADLEAITGVLVAGDGTARRTEKAPGHLDVRAEPFDVEIARLIAVGDAVGLATLDVELAEELMCGGATVWRWLGGLVGSAPVRRAELVSHTAPYGVAYFVGSWTF